MSVHFDLTGHALKRGYTLVEASAGTGKTYSITWLVTRLLLERELEADELLVVTFTIAATEELDSRIRAHLTDVLARWPRREEITALAAAHTSGDGPTISEHLGGELGGLWRALTPEQRLEAPRRLQRALDRFDFAQISTIHGFCKDLLQEFSLESGVDAQQIQTHLTPLFDEVAQDYRSLILSSASHDALRLMNALASKLKHAPEDLIKICKQLEPGGWAHVACDALKLPETPRRVASDHLKMLTQASQRERLPDPPATFSEPDEREEDTTPVGAESTRAEYTRAESTGAESTGAESTAESALDTALFSESELNIGQVQAQITPQDVIDAWDHLGALFDDTLSLRLLPALTREEWREGLHAALDSMNELAAWKKSGGPGIQALGWEAVELLLETHTRGDSITGVVVALHRDLAHLSTRKLTEALNRTKKKVNGAFFDFSHPLSDALDELVALMEEVTETLRGWFRWGFACYAQRELPRRKREEGWISTNDLIRFTYEALARPDGLFLARARERFGAALIDEFQDTDPMQWGIFSQIFNPDVSDAITYLIGDPKQSVYRFRGADLNAYLAVKLGIAPERRYTMSRNFRSDPRLLDALNQHFDPRQERFRANHWELAPAGEPSSDAGFFCDEHVPYVHVDGGRPDRLSGLPALRWRYFDLELGLSSRDATLADYVAEDVCQTLLSGHRIGPVDEPERQRPIGLSDIGVLTRTNKFALEVADALARRGIASTIRTDDSVFKTGAALQLERLMRAALLPEDEEALSAALAVELLAFDARAVRERATTLKPLFIHLHQLWITQGLAASFHGLLHHPELGLVTRALRQPDGARDLSRLMHVAERAQMRASSMGLTPELTLQWLRERRLEVDVEVAEEDVVRPHIDTEAVQVVTVHRSKGLEYPILFCPDLWIVGGYRSGDIRVTEPEAPGAARALDLRLNSSPELDAIDAQLKEAERREERRLLYVALTRAAHHCSLYLAVGKQRFAQGALYPMMMGLTPPPTGKPKREELARVILEQGEQRFLEGAGQVVFEVEYRPPKLTSWGGERQDERPLAVHSTPNPTRSAWRHTSFTSLTQVLTARTSAPVTLEELPELDEGLRGQTRAPIEHHGEPPPLMHLSGSARFGQCVHALLERLDFTSELSEVTRLTRSMLRAWGFDLNLAERVARGIHLALQTPLASPAPPRDADSETRRAYELHNLSDIRLCDLKRDTRRDEVSFELPLAPDRPLSGALLNRILRLDPACYDLPDFPEGFELQGFLKGSVDLLFRIERAGVMRYYLADYKTLWIGDERGAHLGHYLPEALRGVMNAHLYHLQSHLYQVAISRLLKQRLGASYRSHIHFGGALYLFLRGMAGQESRVMMNGVDQGAAGVYIHRPPPRVTELLSLALSDPERAEQTLGDLFGGVSFNVSRSRS